MLNHKKPSQEARIIYKNDAARKDLGIEFNPVIIPLTEFSKQKKQRPTIAKSNCCYSPPNRWRQFQISYIKK